MSVLRTNGPLVYVCTCSMWQVRYAVHKSNIPKQRGNYTVDMYLILLIHHTYLAVNMPRNCDILSYLLYMSDVCVVSPGLSFRIYGVSATYVWRISRINGVCATYVLLLWSYWSMCDILGVFGISFSFQENLNASIYVNLLAINV